jgi:hypothetical protein
VLSVCATRRAWRLTSSAAGAAADEAGHGIARPACAGHLAGNLGDLPPRVVEFALQLPELGDQRLHRRFRVIEQHEADRTDDHTLVIAQGQPADQKGAGLVAQQVDQDRLAAVDHVAHQRVGHDLLDPSADEVRFVVAEGGQEALVAFADPDNAVLAVDDHRSHRAGREHLEQALRREREHAVGVERQFVGGHRRAEAGPTMLPQAADAPGALDAPGRLTAWLCGPSSSTCGRSPRIPPWPR